MLPPVAPVPLRVIVLLSGGLDSTVALAQTVADGHHIDRVVTFNYGQRALAPELSASKALCKHYGLAQQVISLPWLASVLPQALTPVNQLTSPELVTQATHLETKRVWVPNRNGVLLNIAAAVAEGHGASHVVFGANAQEAQGFPDNTPDFKQAINQSLWYSTLNHVVVSTPVGHLHKADIIRQGLALNVPLPLIWSCYEDGDTHCGVCPSCLLLKQALADVDQSTLIKFLNH
jgi:7-cyano-7-deazaguanine synthase